MSSPIKTRTLGGDAKDVKVGAVGHGLMLLTWIPPPQVPDDEAFASMKAAADAGATFWNSGQFYGPPENPMANLELLNRFFEKYPEYVDKIVLSVKGGMSPQGLHGGPDATEENLRNDLKKITKALGSRKKLDIYECARVDPKLTIEEATKNMVTLKNEGYFKYIGMSECAATALRKAHAIHPIAAVEIELSLWSLEDEALEVLKACDELGIALVAYSPLGRGFLTGKWKSLDDMPEGDMRKHMPRFQGENWNTNMKLVEEVQILAKKKGVAPSQLALAYIMSMSPHVIPIPGSSSTQRALENIGAANVELSKEEIDEIKGVLDQFQVQGDRYPAHMKGLNWGTGKQA